MAEYSRIARGSFFTSETTQIVNLPFQPTRVELENVGAHRSPSQYLTTSAFWDISMGQGVADQEYISTTVFPWTVASDYVPAGGIMSFGLLSPVNAGLMLQYGAQLQIEGITAVDNPVVTTASPHGLTSGQVVILEGLYQTSTTGMPQMATIPFVISVDTPTTFTIDWDASGSHYTALSGSPVGAFVRQVLFPWNYLPGQNVITSIGLGATTFVTTTSNHNYVIGQQVAFRIPSIWGTTQLNSLPNNQTPGSPMYGYVIGIESNTEFEVNINSTSFTAFNSNPTVAQAIGLTPAQVVAVGDVNSGGWPYTGGSLYPSPQFPTYPGSGFPTINGPAIQGAFVNNTAQGFIVGSGSGQAATAALASAPLLVGSELYVWTAYLFDLG